MEFLQIVLTKTVALIVTAHGTLPACDVLTLFFGCSIPVTALATPSLMTAALSHNFYSGSLTNVEIRSGSYTSTYSRDELLSNVRRCSTHCDSEQVDEI